MGRGVSFGCASGVLSPEVERSWGVELDGDPCVSGDEYCRKGAGDGWIMEVFLMTALTFRMSSSNLAKRASRV